MARNDLLPDGRTPMVNRDLSPTPPYFAFLQALAKRVGGDQALELIRQIAIILGSPDGDVSKIPPQAAGQYLSINTRVQGDMSIETNGILAQGWVGFQLVGDVLDPLPTSYYGTGPLGEKGWRTIASAFLAGVGITLTEAEDGTGVITVALAELEDSGAGALVAITRDAYGRVEGMKPATITGTAGRIVVANGDAVAGLPTVDLAEVPDGGAGTLQKTARDAYGRMTDTSAATTDDLPEGATNPYFTAARAVAALEDTGPDYLQLLHDEYNPP
ncbi:hypothetical protein ACI2IY_05630 [Lysobacter enzymogenes]|uniref:hypothetical protein n=1 Tax=Lysobacter enzymogenes TaxID=69 RepID=UPI00384B3515